MGESEATQVAVEAASEDDGPESALTSLPPHLRRFAELRETENKTLEECVEAVRPGQYANPKDAGWRWVHRKDVQAAMAELRAEAIRRSARRASDVLDGMWKVHDRCMQKVSPVLNRKGEHLTTETPDGEALAYEFDANGAMRALESLANYHGMTKQRTEITGKDGGPIETADRSVNTNVPDDPIEAARFYREMIQAEKPKK